MNYPITPAIRFLRSRKVDFKPHLFEYVEKGGTAHSAQALGVAEHNVIKTLVFETNDNHPLIVLQHGDLQVSTKNLARHLRVKSVTPAKPERAGNLTGYVFGGTSPFGLRVKMPIFAESSIFELEKIYINGGKRGFLVEITPRDFRSLLEIELVDVGIRKPSV